MYQLTFEVNCVVCIPATVVLPKVAVLPPSAVDSEIEMDDGLAGMNVRR